jgi:hypothetical protein
MYCYILLYTAMYCYALLSTAIYYYVLLYTAMYCYILLCTAIYCYILLRTAIYCYLKCIVYAKLLKARQSFPITLYVATYLPTRNSSATVTISRKLWMVFILLLAVGFDGHRAGSEPHIYSSWPRAGGT